MVGIRIRSEYRLDAYLLAYLPFHRSPKLHENEFRNKRIGNPIGVTKSNRRLPERPAPLASRPGCIVCEVYTQLSSPPPAPIPHTYTAPAHPPSAMYCSLRPRREATTSKRDRGEHAGGEKERLGGACPKIKKRMGGQRKPCLRVDCPDAIDCTHCRYVSTKGLWHRPGQGASDEAGLQGLKHQL